MSSNSSSSIIASLQAEIAVLRAREASLTRIAAQSVAVIRAQDDDSRVEGMWLREDDQPLLEAIHEGDIAQAAGRPWCWTKLERPIASPASIAITPFRSAFPLEILEHIVHLAGPKALASFARASFGCLQMFGPLVLKNATVPRKVTGPISRHTRQSGLDDMFTGRDARSSSRLASALSLHHIQVLDVLASASEPLSVHAPPRFISSARLVPGAPVLQLSKLVIRMDFDAYTLVEADSDDYDSDDSDISVLGRMHPAVHTWRPSLEILDLLDPTELIFRNQAPGLSTQDYYYHYRVTRAASVIIASWTRLQMVELDRLDLYVINNVYGDEDILIDYDITMDLRQFFLTPAIVSPLRGAEPTGRAHKWDLSGRDRVSAFGWGETQSLPAQLATRDDTLRSSWVRDAVIVVKNKKLEAKVREEIQEVDVKLRGPLRVEVKQA